MFKVSENFSECSLRLRGFIPRAARARFQLHTIEQQLQRLRRQPKFRVRLPGAVRPVKRAFLQTLGQHTHAGAVRVEQFDPVMPPVAEDKESAALGIFAQAFLRRRPQKWTPVFGPLAKLGFSGFAGENPTAKP